jgi:hypothetical protein
MWPVDLTRDRMETRMQLIFDRWINYLTGGAIKSLRWRRSMEFQRTTPLVSLPRRMA